jgi:hypothetical protein
MTDEPPIKRVRRPLPDLYREETPEPEPEEPASDIDRLPDVALVALIVNLPDETTRSRMCRSNKRAYNLCRGPDVYRELVERDFFRFRDDRELQRLRAALPTVAGGAMERGRLVGAIMNREAELLQIMTAEKIEMAGVGPKTWHQYYHALVLLRETSIPNSTDAELFEWNLNDLLRDSIIKNDDLAVFKACVFDGLIPLGFDGTSSSRSLLFKMIANARLESERATGTALMIITMDAFDRALRVAGRVIGVTISAIVMRMFLEWFRGRRVHDIALTRMLGVILRTEEVLSSTPGRIGDRIRPFRADFYLKDVVSNILKLAGHGYDAAVALLVDAAARWLAGNAFGLARLRRSLRAKLIAPSRELLDLIDDKLK